MPGSGNARRNASSSPSGFLRRRTELKSYMNRNRKSSGSPSASRVAPRIPGGSATGVGMRTTGTGATALSTSATKPLPAHTSSTWSNAPSQRSGNVETSHHHRPIV